jgi:cytochrome c
MTPMSDKKWITAGLAVFFAVALFPLWYNFGKAAPAPEPVLTAKAKAAGNCVLPKEEMKAGHMKVLDAWRDAVVRKGERMYTSTNGKTFNMSLSSGEASCIGCHTNKAEFCDRCHNYASVRPYCWDCHNEPKEKM